MTLEQIDKQIIELKAKKKEQLKKQKQKELLLQRQQNARKRKIENRVKYIIGGYVISTDTGYIKKLLAEKSDKLRDADRDTLQKYLSN